MPLPSLICHCLVGPPSSGKTTFAHLLAAQLNRLGQANCIIGADQVREQLYGDVVIQGAWAEIEPELLTAMAGAIQAGKAVIYDATNAYRWWRQSLLAKVGQGKVVWVAWVLTTPAEVCLQWNSTRTRQVPQAIIRKFAQALKRFPVSPAEEFVSVFEIDPLQISTSALGQRIEQNLEQLPGSIRNRQNRTKYFEPHGYSRLIDFDRLMHLLSLLIRYPGLGQLHHGDPDLLLRLLGTEILPPLLTPVDEIAAVLSSQYHEIYGDVGALTTDLAWLTANGFLSQGSSETPLGKPPPTAAVMNTHRHSDWLCFQRLMATVRYILHHPLDQVPLATTDASTPVSMVDCLALQLHQARILPNADAASLRKDIQLVLRPYGLLPEKPLRKGYCLGTGILTQEDLLRVYHLAQKQVEGLDDVMDRAVLERFEQRLRWAQFDLDHERPVRVISSGSIVNPDYLSEESLARPNLLTELEAHIRQGHKMRINRRQGAAQFAGYASQEEEIWPLEIIFHNIAWYLGYEVAAGPALGLLRYERLDRLYQVNATAYQRRSATKQHQARQGISTLRQYSAGIFLGTDPQAQAKFLHLSHPQRLKTMDKLELQFTESLFSFISEGTQRFPRDQIQMTRAKTMSQFLKPDLQAMFKLPKAQDATHPYRFTVKLPAWSFHDVTLKAWVLGFGPGVKVIKPESFKAWIMAELNQTQQLYPETLTVHLPQTNH